MRTIRLLATLEFEYHFDAHQLELNLDGVPGDVLPTDAAMEQVMFELDRLNRTLAPTRIELDVAGPMCGHCEERR